MLVLRQVRPWGGALVDVVVEEGRITAIGQRLPPGDLEIEGMGDLLLPGLHDHHLHLLALAASKQSVSLSGLTSEAEVRAALSTAPAGQWVRAVDYDERAASLPDRHSLDRWIADRPLRLADRTGALRVLNSAALALLAGRALPPGAERDGSGAPTGRFWREDQWLANALPTPPPDLASLGEELAGYGLTGLTDAGAHNGPAEAALLSGSFPQRLVLMGCEALVQGEGYELGPLKLLIDERDPPAPDDLAARIRGVRRADRAVAAHCVTDGELAIFLAALDLAGGGRPGDRIEHGGIVPCAFVPEIAKAGLLVVTNPAFIHDRGDRYCATIPEAAWHELYPAASLSRAGIALLAGSDAPYACVDPWLGMRSARSRMTRSGTIVGASERLNALNALRLYCSGAIAVGLQADLMLCAGSLADVLSDLSAERVRTTIVDAEVVFSRDPTASIRR